MSSLKQDMRQRFEKHSSMAFYENNSNFEEGLLEKIMNFAYANLSPYSSMRWHITAVKSPVLLQKLYKAVNERRIAESAIALIICKDAGQFPDSGKYEISCENKSTREGCCEDDQRDIELLALSIGYSAKYFCIDSFIIKTFDREPVLREFALDRRQPIAGIICLGSFRDEVTLCNPTAKNLYSDTVRIL